MTLCNAGTEPLGPGGVGFDVADGRGEPCNASAPNLWPPGRGEHVSLACRVPPPASLMTTIKSISAIAFVAASGKIVEIAGAATVKLLGGVRIENES